MYKVKNAILISISVVMGALFMFSLASLDSPSLFPILGMLISGMWLLAFAAANGAMDIQYEVDFEKDFPDGLEIRPIKCEKGDEYDIYS